MPLLMPVTQPDSEIVDHRNGADENGFTKASVAALSPADVHDMGDDELVRAIRAARLPQLQRIPRGRLPLKDRETLERLLFLARRSCRNQGY